MDPAAASAPRARDAHVLWDLALLFLRLGATTFGGPAAHIALMQDEVVRRRGWLTREEFLDLLSATNLIPGPNSTEMAIHIGHRQAGHLGLLVAGTCFIVPAALITMALSWAYVRYGGLPQVSGVLYGVKPVIVAIVVQALWGLGSAAVKSRRLAVLGLLALAAGLAGAGELTILVGAGLAMVLLRRFDEGRGKGAAALLLAKGSPLWPAAVGAAAVPFHLSGLFLVFLKIGAVLYGSGYVLLAFLRAELVQGRGWLTETQLLDAVAAGQVTPGPIFTTATFVGYLLGGPGGAAVATLGIFLPAFLFVALSGPLVPRLRRSPDAAAVLDGVNVASLALMAVVTLYLGRAAVQDWKCVALAIASTLILLRFRPNAAWLVLGGGIAGILLS